VTAHQHHGTRWTENSKTGHASIEEANGRQIDSKIVNTSIASSESTYNWQIARQTDKRSTGRATQPRTGQVQACAKKCLMHRGHHIDTSMLRMGAQAQRPGVAVVRVSTIRHLPVSVCMHTGLSMHTFRRRMHAFRSKHACIQVLACRHTSSSHHTIKS
jgi:hypothetical protein